MRTDESRQKETEAAVLIDRAILHLPEGIGSSASRELVSLLMEAAVLRVRAELTVTAGEVTK